MKKIIGAFALGLIFCSMFGCRSKKAPPVNLPEGEVQSIDVTAGGETKNYTDSRWVEQCISGISRAEATAKRTVQDGPRAEEYVQIDINTADAVTSVFVYMEKGRYYIEQPYQGIYETDSAFYEMLTGE